MSLSKPLCPSSSVQHDFGIGVGFKEERGKPGGGDVGVGIVFAQYSVEVVFAEDVRAGCLTFGLEEGELVVGNAVPAPGLSTLLCGFGGLKVGDRGFWLR